MPFKMEINVRARYTALKMLKKWINNFKRNAFN